MFDNLAPVKAGHASSLKRQEEELVQSWLQILQPCINVLLYGIAQGLPPYWMVELYNAQHLRLTNQDFKSMPKGVHEALNEQGMAIRYDKDYGYRLVISSSAIPYFEETT